MNDEKISEFNFGLDYEKNKEDSQRPENYQFGSVEKIVLREDGQWLDFDPECEIQKTDHDDLMDCVSESETNFKKIILKRKFNIDADLSQRFRAKMSGTTRTGNSLHAVANSARHDGFVLEIEWPRNRGMAWDEYYKSIPGSVINRALKTTIQFDVNYEFVPTNKEALMEALKYGPVQVTGHAWASQDGIYYDYGYRPNHAFLLVGYIKNKYWIAYDSYPTDYIIDENSTKQEFIKYLDWNYKFGDALLYSVKLKATDQRSWIFKIIDMLKNFYRDIKSGKSYFVKSVNGKVMKQEITSVNGILTLLHVNFGAKQTDWGELSNYEDHKFFN